MHLRPLSRTPYRLLWVWVMQGATRFGQCNSEPAMAVLATLSRPAPAWPSQSRIVKLLRLDADEVLLDSWLCGKHWGDEFAHRRTGPGRWVRGVAKRPCQRRCWQAIERYIRRVVDSVAGEDWQEIALQLDSRLGKWDSADYVP